MISSKTFAKICSRSSILFRTISQRKFLSTKISTENNNNNPNAATSSSPDTHFGFETVSEAEKSEKVYKVFENVATTYDLMNDVMSGGVHRFWKDYFMEKLSPTSNTKLIDVAGGTGDIAFRFLKHAQFSASDRQTVENETYHVTVVDINKSMLEVGRQRCKNLHIDDRKTSWIEADAENLPFENEIFDAYTIAFGIRNCTHVDKVLSEAFRVLKPGGRFLCLEFSQVMSPILSKLYDAYSFNVIPAMGYLIAKDWQSYQYLVESIRKFPNQQEFAWMIEDAGFCNVSFENLTFGVCAIHSGFKF